MRALHSRAFPHVADAGCTAGGDLSTFGLIRVQCAAESYAAARAHRPRGAKLHERLEYVAHVAEFRLGQTAAIA
jgi:hypothetical protein